jgi:hypothetical protein
MAVCVDDVRVYLILPISDFFFFQKTIPQSKSFTQWSFRMCWNVRIDNQSHSFVYALCPDRTNLVHGTYRLFFVLALSFTFCTRLATTIVTIIVEQIDVIFTVINSFRKCS